MNLYFLVEGKRTEKKVYPQWLLYLLPHFKQVKRFDEAEKYNYFLFSSEGYPSILDDINGASEEINENGKYSHLIVCLDADESTVDERKNEVLESIESMSINLKAELVIIVQNKCFETWFLGNRKVFSRNPQDETFKEYSRFFNVSTHDPELMPDYPGFGSISQFHEAYLKLMLKEKNLSYTKKAPGEVAKEHYIKELQKRTEDTAHLPSLKTFLDFCREIKPIV